jgi:hypothetical protein
MGPDSSESVGCIGDVNLYGHARVVFGWPNLIWESILENIVQLVKNNT